MEEEMEAESKENETKIEQMKTELESILINPFQGKFSNLKIFSVGFLFFYCDCVIPPSPNTESRLVKSATLYYFYPLFLKNISWPNLVNDFS